MKKEQRILASNFAVIGHLLNEHIIEVFDALEYTLETETPKKFCESDFRRHVLVHLLVDLILGPLDVEPNLNALLKFHPVPSLSRIAEIFIECFNKIQPSDFQFFTPPELRKGNRSEVLSVNRSDQCLGQHCTLPDCVWEGKNEDASTSKETFVDHQPLPLLPLLYSPGAVDLCWRRSPICENRLNRILVLVVSFPPSNEVLLVVDSDKQHSTQVYKFIH